MFPPLCSAQKQQAMPPLSAELWMPGLPAEEPAAYISTRQGRKNPVLGKAWWVVEVSAPPGWGSYGQFARGKLRQRAAKART